MSKVTSEVCNVSFLHIFSLRQKNISQWDGCKMLLYLENLIYLLIIVIRGETFC